jgi:hypothetical protein
MYTIKPVTGERCQSQWSSGRRLAGIGGSNPAEGLDDSLVTVVRFEIEVSVPPFEEYYRLVCHCV